MTREPIATHCMGKSVYSIWLPLSPRKVLTIRFHFSASDVSPPATIKPVAGHITQRKVIGNVCSEIIPCESRNGGSINQLMAVPMAIAKQIRKPTSRPEPNDSRLKLKPIFIGCMPGRNQVSLIHLKYVVTAISAPEASVPSPRAFKGPEDVPFSRPSCNTLMV